LNAVPVPIAVDPDHAGRGGRRLRFDEGRRWRTRDVDDTRWSLFDRRYATRQKERAEETGKLLL